MRMHKINLLFSLSSLSVLLVTIERFSFTTKILLQPYNFLRLHEVFQMAVLILFTTIIPFLLFREVSNNFELLKTKKGLLVACIFITGVYFYATGNGVHELASFQFNTYCNTKDVAGNLCGGMFFNDYYFGNIVYFIGAVLMNITLLFLEYTRPITDFTKKDLTALIINSLIYSFAIFAYAAFDRVSVGFYYSLVMFLTAVFFTVYRKRKLINLPLTTYTLIAYSTSTLIAALIRFR